MNFDIEASAEAHANELNKGLIQIGKDLSVSVLIGFTLVALAIYSKK